MSFIPSSQFNGEHSFETILNDLAHFGEKGHERIEIREDRNGSYFPVTAAKPRRIRWFLLLCYKSAETREKTVAQFVLKFLQTNEKLLEANRKARPDTVAEVLTRVGLLIRKGCKETDWKSFKDIVNVPILTMTKEAREFSSALAPRLRHIPPEGSDAVTLITKDGGLESVKVHRSVLQVYAQREADEKIQENRTSNFFEGFLKKGWEASQEIHITENYPSSTVNALVDFLYGVPKIYKAADIADLIGVLALAHEFGLNDLHQTCKKVCLKLFQQSPSSFADAVVSPGAFHPSVFEWLSKNMEQLDYLPEEQRENFFKVVDACPDTLTIRILKARCYLFGFGVQTHLASALKLLREADDQGSVYAQKLLGVCYERGIGIAKNMKKAIALYQEADAQNLPAAKDKLVIWLY